MSCKGLVLYLTIFNYGINCVLTEILNYFIVFSNLYFLKRKHLRNLYLSPCVLFFVLIPNSYWFILSSPGVLVVSVGALDMSRGMWIMMSQILNVMTCENNITQRCDVRRHNCNLKSSLIVSLLHPIHICMSFFFLVVTMVFIDMKLSRKRER